MIGAPRARPIRIVIADDHAIVREGLRALIESQPGLEVVGEASDADEAYQRACAFRPDVLLLDISMPGGGGIEAAERITRNCPGVHVLALTMHEERGYVARLVRAGAAGYVLKRTVSAELVQAIRAVAAGGQYVDPSLASTLLSGQLHLSARRIMADRIAAAHLTARELELLRLAARGHSNKELATLLSISVKTVETHKANGMTKLGLRTRTELVSYGIAEGWLAEDGS